jgi:predicted acyltransferase
MNPTPPVVAPAPARLASVDAFRGFVMLLMMAEVLRLRRVAEALPESGLWAFLARQQTHVEWVGASLHDLIQPGFSFLVGVALPFSIANRLARGQDRTAMALHAFWRALLLVLLGVFLRSLSRTTTYWTFEDTLTQIGLGYGFLFVLGFRPVRDQWLAFGAVLAATWTAFALWPLPPADFDYAGVGVSADWLAAHGHSGFAAHWQKGTNLAAAFDTWFLNLFPRERPFVYHPGGYATLSFVPTLATMILGLLAGNVLKGDREPAARLRWFAFAGVGCIAAGALFGWVGLCPVVKRIWTPGWVLYSGGWCLLLMGAFYKLVDLCNGRRWSFVLVVVGMNSIAAYLIAHLFRGFIAKNLTTHLGTDVFRTFGPAFEPLLHGAVTLAIMWLILWWMWRRRLFLKI